MAATKVQNPRELFLHELGEMLFTERALAEEVLPQLSKEVQNPQLRQGLEQHRQQTQEHARNVARAFELLGEQPQAKPNPALRGLQQAHDQMAPNIGRQELRDLFDAGAAAKTEHLEIAAYKDLIAMAQQIGTSEVQQLLQTNCTQEEQNLQRLEMSSRHMAQQVASV
jgi:ferritin-like metal-binding protein YciE